MRRFKKKRKNSIKHADLRGWVLHYIARHPHSSIDTLVEASGEPKQTMVPAVYSMQYDGFLKIISYLGNQNLDLTGKGRDFIIVNKEEE